MITNYTLLLLEITKFFNVNDDLRNDLNNTCIEFYEKSLDDLLILWARKHAKSAHIDAILSELKELNKGPHSISEIETLYEFIDDFSNVIN